MEKFKKWIENYWYYYKYHTIIIGVFLIAALLCIKSCNDTANPDISAMLVTHRISDEAEYTAFSDGFAKYVDDKNGDGEIRIDLSTIYFNTDNISLLRSMSQKLALCISASDIRLYFFDDVGYEKINNANAFMDITYLIPDAKDGKYITIDTSLILDEKLRKQLPEKINVGLRYYNENDLKDEKISDGIKRAEDILKTLYEKNK